MSFTIQLTGFTLGASILNVDLYGCTGTTLQCTGQTINNLTDYFFSYGINSNDFLFRHKVHKSKILSFLNSFDSERLKSLSEIYNKKDDQYFLFVGRISFEKNIDFLIQLAIKLKEANSNILINVK